MKKAKFILILIVIAVVGLGGYYLWSQSTQEVNSSVKKNTVTETHTTISGDIIKAGLADIGELATEEYYFTEVETYDSSKKYKDFKLPFTTSRFVYSYDGTIKAGIDFAQIEVNKDDSKKVITVTLPKSRILSSEVDEDSFQIYDEKRSIFNPVSVSDFNAANSELKKKAEEDALDRGVLEKADENAVVLVKNFLMSTYEISDYKIKVVTEK